jgi:CRISPR-associated protein Csd2
MATRDPSSGTQSNEIPTISARDPEVLELFPDEFHKLYEVYSYRNALHVLSRACEAEFDQIIDTLVGFRINTIDMVTPGGNKSKIARAMEDLLKPLHWNETRIVADLNITRITRVRELRVVQSGKNKGQTKGRSRENREQYKIPNFVAGHKVDFVKGRVAFDMEWNSKDQTFDRDLNAVRALYECNIVAAGVLLTRSAELVPLFREIQNRTNIDKFASKYGASTTWMKKLTDRLDAGRAGGCPILAIGIKPTVVSDFEEWKVAHPVKRDAPFAIDGPADETEEC